MGRNLFKLVMGRNLFKLVKDLGGGILSPSKLGYFTSDDDDET